MKRASQELDLRRLLEALACGHGTEAEPARIPVSDYVSEQRLLQEKQLLSRMPLIVGHGSQIAQPGDYFLHEALGKPYLIVRGEDGVARAFLNVCRHRGTKLLHEPSGHGLTRLTCPYHAWTYDLQGKLRAVPDRHQFCESELTGLGLRSVSLQERYGFLWLTGADNAADDVSRHLDALAEEFAEFGFDRQVVGFCRSRELKANWKLPLDAFLEPYHIGVLHRQTISKYFVPNLALSDRVGRNFRSIVPRLALSELSAPPSAERNFREFYTLTYIIFPNTCFIFHPHSVSVISVYPLASNRSCWAHMLVLPALPESAEDKQHLDNTIAVLDESVYEHEDFWIAEQMQAGHESGANNNIILGRTESAIKAFHDVIATAIGELCV